MNPSTKRSLCKEKDSPKHIISATERKIESNSYKVYEIDRREIHHPKRILFFNSDVRSIPRPWAQRGRRSLRRRKSPRIRSETSGFPRTLYSTRKREQFCSGRPGDLGEGGTRVGPKGGAAFLQIRSLFNGNLVNKNLYQITVITNNN